MNERVSWNVFLFGMLERHHCFGIGRPAPTWHTAITHFIRSYLHKLYQRASEQFRLLIYRRIYSWLAH